jgi:hypothetical protein
MIAVARGCCRRPTVHYHLDTLKGVGMENSRDSHPVSRPMLVQLMICFLVIGGLLTLAGTGRDYDPSFVPLVMTAAKLSFGCFLILFAIYWAGWLVREHVLWRERLRESSKSQDEELPY